VENRGPIWHLKRYLNSLFELPDKHIGWLVPAVWRALKVIRKEGIKVVIISSPPGTTGLVGLALAVLSDVKVITDFRDPWYWPEHDPEESRSLLSDRIRRALERKIVERSTHVVTTTRQYVERLQTLHPAVPKDKFHIIWNGYDAPDFQELGSGEKSSKLRFGYLGTFYIGRTPKQFLRAVGELVQEKALSTSEIEITFTGKVRHAEGERVEELARSCGLENCVKLQDPVSYGEALREMTNSDVLLLLAEAQYYCIPAKTFEYMAVKKKILCVARDGATADLIRETGAGAVVNPDSLDQMKSAIMQLYEEHRSEESNNNSPFDPSNFERQHLARQLLDLVEDAVK
jgi:glycosyltransferase involved in cell wall biosynthesis